MIELKNFERFEFFKAFSEGFISPFITIFALTLGASNFLIGSLSASVKLTSLISQLIFSLWLLRRRGKFFLLTSTLSWSLMWIVIGTSKNPYELIAFLSIQAIFSSLIILSWTELIVNLIPAYKRGRIIGRLNWWNAFGAILATLASGYILTNYGFISFVFFIAFAFGALASLNFLPLRGFFPPILMPKVEFWKAWLEIRKTRDFLSLVSGKAFFGFAVGLAGPFFAIYVVTKLGGSVMDVAFISIVNLLSHLLFYRSWGFVADWIGRKVTIISSIPLIALLPLGYALALDVLFLYPFVILAGIGWSGFNIATFAYFSDVAERKNVFQLTGFYNSSIGISEMAGNFLGGVMAMQFNLSTVFIFSFALRLLAIGFFLNLKEETGSEAVKFKTTIEPFHFIETSTTTYLILFSVLKKTTIERFSERVYRFFRKMVRRIFWQLA